MNNEDGRDNKSQHESEDSSPIEDIPLWLQGLDEYQSDRGETEKISQDRDDNWIKEESQETRKTYLPVNQIENPNEPDFDIPDWLNELSNEETGPTSAKAPEQKAFERDSELIEPLNESIGEKPPESIDQEAIPDAVTESCPDQEESVPQEEAFIEIPDENFNGPLEPADFDPIGEFNTDNELPDWLQEMISEPVEELDGIDDISFNTISEMVNEPTQPVEIKELFLENDDTVNFSDAEVTDEIDVPLDFQEPEEVEETEIIEEVETNSQVDQEIQGSDSPSEEVIERDMKPFDSEVVTIEEALDRQDTEKPQSTQITEVPKALQFAQKLFIQGDINEAMLIVNTYIEREVFLDEIQFWLTDAVNDKEANRDRVWESLGDIALKQGKPEEAFEAYTNAIKTLLKYQEEYHEID